MVYHSALKEELEITEELSFFENDGNVVFEWDITDGVHELFRNADALYCEPSWKHGYPKFLRRAGCDDSTFSQYLGALKTIITELAIPSYVVIGKHMMKSLRPPGATPVKIHGYDALVGTWNCTAPNVNSTKELLQYVCNEYETILDPCCGYGVIAKYALQFICSDINKKCVYYVAKTFMGYSE